MSVHPGLMEAIYHACDARDLAMQYGVGGEELMRFIGQTSAEILVPAYKEFGLVKRTRPNTKPRRDWSKATPRLPDLEWQKLRREIFDRDGRICRYCCTTEGRFCVDHVLALSRGGSNNPDNLVVACVPCNSSKNDKLLGEWRGLYQ